MNRKHLGAFTVGSELGRGGMGVVYRGRHTDGTPVAIKVIAAKFAQTERRRREFRREVHAMARLSHPNIVTVFDTGMTAEGDETMPWYAMELIDGSALTGSALDGGWLQIKMLLLELLDALAHAHARGVLHRDLKPANILLSCDQGDIRPILVDFGVSRALHVDAEHPQTTTSHITGTPNYMAPEQVAGRWRDEGPWTDLYALGCVVWRLVTGSVPFPRKTSKQVLSAHLQDELPTFEPIVEVPEELEDWLRALLEKSPRRRLRRAADAAYALFRMRSASSSFSSGADMALEKTMDIVDEPTAAPTARLPTLASIADTLIDSSLADFEAVAHSDDHLARRHWPVPPLPPNWKRLSSHAEPKRLTGAGLGLFGLRDISVIGREVTRKAMWEQLRRVRAEKRPRATVLRGPTGCGKSRLAEWLGRRAHESGSAIVVEARHSPHGGPMDGLGAMLRRFFCAGGLTREEILERVRRFYQATSLDKDVYFYDAVILTEAIVATQAFAHGEQRTGDISVDEQLDVLARFFGELAAERPVLLIVEDAQWAGQTLALVRRLLDASAGEPLPLLVIATAGDRADSEPSYASEQFAAVCEHRHCQLFRLDRLGPEDQRVLIKRVLGLTDETIERVIERTDGNPLFAIQLLDDWVDQDELKATAEGFIPARPLQEAIPRDPGELWRRRIDHLLGAIDSRQREKARTALEAAALLGQHLADEEWRVLSDQVGLTAADQLVDEMSSRNLARRARDGWSFRHGGLCDTLETTAQHTGRLIDHHKRCADVLTELYPQSDPQALARRANHLYQAQEYERALAPLLRTAELMLYEAPLASVKRQLSLCKEATARLDRADVPAESSRLLALWGWYHRRAGDMQKGLACTQEAVDMALDREWTEAAAFALSMKGILLKQLGQFRDAQETIEQAVELFGPGSDPFVVARALCHLALTARSQGRLATSITHFHQALAVCEQAQIPVLRALIECQLGYSEFCRGNHRRAQELIDHSRRCLERFGQRGAVGTAFNNSGDIARHEGRWEDALGYYRRAAECSRQRYEHGNLIVKLNSAFVDVGQGRWEEAEPRLEKLHDAATHTGQGEMHPHILLALAGCAAHACDEAKFRRQLAPAIERIDADQMADKDLAWLAELVAHKAQKRGWQAPCEALFRLARAQYAQLEDHKSQRRIDASLASLEPH